jgi:hypothetical protein
MTREIEPYTHLTGFLQNKVIVGSYFMSLSLIF